MTDLCTALADALRKAAVKWPERFELENDEENQWVCIEAAGGFVNLYLKELHDPQMLSLDEMDAVAAALGMRFTVNMDPSGNYWWAIWKRPHKDCRWYVHATDVVSSYPDKRTASLAALLAILNHKLQEDGK